MHIVSHATPSRTTPSHVIPSLTTPSHTSPSQHAQHIKASNVPLLLVAGWLDTTAVSALHLGVHAAAPGSRVLLGPWGHAGEMRRMGRGGVGSGDEHGVMVVVMMVYVCTHIQ